MPLGRELDGVAHEIDQHLPQPARIAAQLPGHVFQDTWQARSSAFGLSFFREQVHRAFHGRLQVEVEFLEVELARLDLGESRGCR